MSDVIEQARRGVEAYTTNGLDTVPGWFDEASARVFLVIDAAQRGLGIAGDLLEIGVHLGRSAILLGYMRRQDERLVVNDLFETATGPVTEMFYRGQSKDRFLANYARWHPEPPEVRMCPSSQLRPDRTFRFVHVDGSHEYADVAADIALVRSALIPGGVVAFDDVYTGRHIGVPAAVWEAVVRGDLRPILTTDSKFYAVADDASPTAAAVLAELDRRPSFATEMHAVFGQEVPFAAYTADQQPRSLAQRALDLLTPPLVGWAKLKLHGAASSIRPPRSPAATD